MWLAENVLIFCWCHVRVMFGTAHIRGGALSPLNPPEPAPKSLDPKGPDPKPTQIAHNIITQMSISQNGKLRDMCEDIWNVPTRDSQCHSVQQVSLVVF